MIVRPLTPETALYVAVNMRDSDAREIFATRRDEDRARLAADTARRGDFAWCAGDGEPIVAIGVVFLWPGVWQAWMFATDRFDAVGFPLTRWVRRVMMPEIDRTGAHRVQAYSIEGHHQAHRWLEGLGAVHEFTHPNYGKNREPFRAYAWNRA